jgi:hypothetical protein
MTCRKEDLAGNRWQVRFDHLRESLYFLNGIEELHLAVLFFNKAMSRKFTCSE